MPKPTTKHKLTDRDCALIDDLRQAFIHTHIELPSGDVFDGSTPAAQVGFENAAAMVVNERSRMVKQK